MRLLILPGDGIGPEITQATLQVLHAADAAMGLGPELEMADIGLKLSDGLFLREVRKVAQGYPVVQLDEVIVDAAAALLIRQPDRFDVIVTTNMFGDILSDEAAELPGSLGPGGSISQGDGICVAQAQHGSAPDIAGQDRANPTALILSAAMLLRWMAGRHGAPRLAQAALAEPAGRTADLGGPLGTAAFAGRVADGLQQEGRG
ncbi:hypothetical protein LHP98_08245 [Rhodobacter sp. Har01]|uniref:isocitrate/isopropylmalate family dehydrogenase n=1 Tax=Rhodobacter sp. Har01 TaxID=2883999 RepID=UPI001D09839B|nr:isocitrate/isopropylmalate family dehydrogenase [Rhodobacter sp. Har01]MCB6178119.1 hypothetical protein [Rhodobacter sp. Har01]